jgi:carboxyl-terminal processing protease
MRPFFALLLVCGTLPVLAEEDLEPQIKRFLEVYTLLEKNAADPINPEDAFYQGVLPGMIRTLDPHSAFLDKSQYESLKEMQRSTEKGFGTVVSLLPGRVIVLQTLPGSPSARAGLSPGDEIMMINRLPLSHLGIEQLASLLGQTRQQRAQLMVKKPGRARLIRLELVPAEMADRSVRRAFLLQPGVGYIRLNNFEQATAQELRQAIERLGGEDLKGLVLDLRRNPGGIVEAAVQAAAFFLKPDQNILWIRAREGAAEEVKVPEGFQPYEFPLCVLIDDRTASAAELLAGALQDHDRAHVLGQPSFGKGLVQSVFELSEGTALALTTAKYLTPSGRSIQRPLGDCESYALVDCEPDKTQQQEFRSDAGRLLRAGGGVVPDEMIPPRAYDQFEAAMEGSNSFLEFAQQYIRQHGKVGEDFEVSSRLLDEFQLFLSERNIRPSLSQWSSKVDFIRSRLKQELFNLALGVEKGDEVEAQRDQGVRRALRVLEEKQDGGS